MAIELNIHIPEIQSVANALNGLTGGDVSPAALLEIKAAIHDAVATISTRIDSLERRLTLMEAGIGEIRMIEPQIQAAIDAANAEVANNSSVTGSVKTIMLTVAQEIHDMAGRITPQSDPKEIAAAFQSLAAQLRANNSSIADAVVTGTAASAEATAATSGATAGGTTGGTTGGTDTGTGTDTGSGTDTGTGTAAP
jgi:hypothetical protein